MKGIWTKIFAWLLLLLMLGGMICVVCFAVNDTPLLIKAVIGVAFSLVIAPIVHELGHVIFAKANKMQVQYCKCFCFRFYRAGGKAHFGLCNPFAPDETQVVPKGADDMQRRATAYAAGGLVFGGALAFATLAVCIVAWCVSYTAFFAFAMLPYTAYLFLLNAIPAEYASGKTDALVVRGLQKGEAAETAMLNVFRIHGELYEGKSFAEICEEYYFSAPQLPMDEPLYVATLDLRYHYYLETKEYEKASDCLKRIMAAQEYLLDDEVYDLEREIAYISLLGGSAEALKKSTEANPEFWTEDCVKAKRVLALYAASAGDMERAQLLVCQGKGLLSTLSLEGERKHETLLMERALGA